MSADKSQRSLFVDSSALLSDLLKALGCSKDELYAILGGHFDE
jgi:hypothetical protein